MSDADPADHGQGPTAPVASAEARRRAEIDTRGRGLRGHAVRGTLINSGFMVGLFGLGLVQRVAVAAFLTREQFGIWGIVLTTILTLSFLKDVGIADKYVQQTEVDQEAAFQKAFSVELLTSVAFFALVALVLPIYAIVYGQWEIIAPALVLTLSIPLTAFESPFWIPYRRMQFVKQRVLTSIDPLMSLAVTISLAVAGAGYWCFVIGTVAGSAAGAVVGVATCPYRMRLRLDRATIREYASFSLPLFGQGVSALVLVQGALIAARWTVGLSGVGAISFAASFSSFAERVDSIVSQTIYPAVCAVAERKDLLFEVFVKSNRLALMWGLPFGAGLALFAHDFIHYVIGDRWLSAAGLLAVIGLVAGVRQIGFNWAIFMRATNNTRPIFLASLADVACLFIATIPLLATLGLDGYAIAVGTLATVQIVIRGIFLRQLFSNFRIARHVLRAIAPSVPAAAVVLLLRLVLGGHRSPARVLAELVIYLAVTAVATWIFEKKLILEMVSYVKGAGGLRQKAALQEPVTS